MATLQISQNSTLRGKTTPSLEEECGDFLNFRVSFCSLLLLVVTSFPFNLCVYSTMRSFLTILSSLMATLIGPSFCCQ